jgi:hypothetical protein
MAYLKLSDLKGMPKVGGKGFTPGVPHIVVSTNGSKRSNNGSAGKDNWQQRYATKNNARASRASRQPAARSRPNGKA